MNIGFIGYRNCGKTSLSKAVRQRLGWYRVETDKLIEQAFCMSIPQIVGSYSWKIFRLSEAGLMQKYLNYDRTIFDFGGGAVLNHEVMAKLRQRTFIIFLDCTPKTLISRAKRNYFRPPLTGLRLEDEIITTLNERLPLYCKMADYRLRADGLSLSECADLVLKVLYLNKIISKQDIRPAVCSALKEAS